MLMGNGVKDMNCILGREPGDFYRCTKGSCAGCGWNPNELNRRERLLMRYGLQTCSDGLRRLIISEKGALSGERITAKSGGAEKRRADPILRTCGNCGKEFLSEVNNHKYCSGECRRTATNRKKREKRQEEKFSV